METRLRGMWMFKARFLDVARVFRGSNRLIETELSSGETTAHLLTLILTGKYSVRWEQGGRPHRFQAGPGDVVYWPAGVARAEANDPPSPRYTSIAIDFQWSNPPPDLPHKVSDHMGMISALVQTVFSFQANAHPQRQQILNSYLAAMLAEYCRLARSEAQDIEGRLMQYVYNHIREPIGVADLAKHLGVSPRGLQRSFKAVTGQTPMQTVRRIRVEKAAMIISRTGLPLKEVATRVGICDQHELSKLLKKHAHLTSRELRARRPRRD